MKKFLELVEKFLVVSFGTIGTTGALKSLLNDTFPSWALSILGFLTYFFILYLFWVKAGKSRTIVWFGLLMFVIGFPIGLLLYFAPAVGPLFLVYGYLRGFIGDGEDKATAELKEESGKKTYYLIALVIVIIITIVVSLWKPISFVVHSGRRSVPQPENPLLGTKFSFNLPLAYSRDCEGCGGSDRDLEINRDLECIEDLDSLGFHFYKNNTKNLSYIPAATQFTVKEIYKVEPYGAAQIGGSRYLMAVLEDSKGLLSTTLLDVVQDPGSVCINKMTPHIEKMFRYLENKGTMKVVVALYDTEHQTSNVELQKQFIQSLPANLNITQATPINDGGVPGLVGVSIVVDADALVFLVGSELSLKIWEIQGLDSEYLKTLTTQDTVEIKRAPLRF